MPSIGGPFPPHGWGKGHRGWGLSQASAAFVPLSSDGWGISPPVAVAARPVRPPRPSVSPLAPVPPVLSPSFLPGTTPPGGVTVGGAPRRAPHESGAAAGVTYSVPPRCPRYACDQVRRERSSGGLQGRRSPSWVAAGVVGGTTGLTRRLSSPERFLWHLGAREPPTHACVRGSHTLLLARRLTAALSSPEERNRGGAAPNEGTPFDYDLRSDETTR